MANPWKATIETLEKYLFYMKLAGIVRSELRLPKEPADMPKKIRTSLNSWTRKFEKAAVAIKEIRDLVPEETWENYTLHEIEGLREQKMIEERYKTLKQVWKDRPDILRRRASGRPRKSKEA